MLIFLVVLYFLLACVAAWLLLFPAARLRVGGTLAGLAMRLVRQAHGANRAGVHGMTALHGAVLVTLVRLWRVALAHRWLMLGAALLLGLPPGLAWLASGRGMLAGYGGEEPAANLQVRQLLKGEQLVAPVALPPLIFTTQEVVQVRPMLDSASRDWERLTPDFSQRLLTVLQIMKQGHGYDMALLEGYRSPERQTMLAAAGSSVTNARAFQSYHQFGLAADCAFLRDGKLVISEKDPWAMRGYQLYGEVAESLGLHWGGRWTMMDLGHVELRLVGTIRK